MTAFVRKFETFTVDDGQTVVHHWLLAGERGAVFLKASPLSEAGHAISLRYPSINTLVDGWSWSAWDVGYHSPRPTFEGQKAMERCDVLEGTCYYDGSSLQAKDVLDAWAAGSRDDEIIWARLESCYRDWLCSGEEVFVSPVTMLAEALRRVEANS